jgi:polyisoprenoid-binding protein YceI
MKSKLCLLSILLVSSSGISLRAADTYKVDPVHSSVGFAISHMAISTVKGKFDEFSGEVTLEGSEVKGAQGTIQTKSINTGNGKRDEDLRAPNYFDAAKYPTITFQSKRVEKKDGESVLIGDFTMHGVTKELALPITIKGPVKGMGGRDVIGLQAKAKINRKDFGMTGGGKMIGEDVELEINAEAGKGGGR